ncbi:MAG: histone deacetylase [Verrucomicrobiota bacterium]
MKIITDPRCTEYVRPGHPERPQRISGTVEKLRAQQGLPIEWLEPAEVKESTLLRAHSREHLAHLKEPKDEFDADTPAYPKIQDHALRSVGGALRALDEARKGAVTFSLLRPPGHHATRDQAMGFCYLNSIAIAALEALATGAQRVAVFDFDVHHGNGTEAILLGRSDCIYVSVHQYPAYPGTGVRSIKNSFNYPVPPGSSRPAYRAALTQGLESIAQFKPDLIAVSAGFDAYYRDPLCDEPLEAEDFHWLGEKIRGFGITAFSVLEGGYSTDLPELILAYLSGLNGQ